jgi:hypothetical protein
MVNKHRWIKIIFPGILGLFFTIFTVQIILAAEAKRNENFSKDYSFVIPEFSLVQSSSSPYFFNLRPLKEIPEEIATTNSTPAAEAQISSSPIKVTSPEVLFQQHLRAEKIENVFFTSSLITLSLLNLADFITTNKALQYEGLSEGNPLLKPIVKNKIAFGVVKAGLTYVNYQLLKKVHRRNKTLGWILSTLSNAVMSYVVWHNLKMIEMVRSR